MANIREIPIYLKDKKIGMFKLYSDDSLHTLWRKILELKKMISIKSYQYFEANLIFNDDNSTDNDKGTIFSEEHPFNNDCIGIPRNLVYQKEDTNNIFYEFINLNTQCKNLYFYYKVNKIVINCKF